MIQTEVMQDASEIIHYNDPEIPVYVKSACLSDFPFMHIICHWHEDMEFLYIIKGELDYEVNGKKILLQKSDALFVNSRQMHHGTSHQGQDCEYACVLFHPKLFSANKFLYHHYFAPIVECFSLEYIHWAAGTERACLYISYIEKINRLQEQNSPGYELQILSEITEMWKYLYEDALPYLGMQTDSPDSSVMTQRKMVSYIYAHYMETISLDEIAEAGNVSRSQCCRIFRKYLQQSPADFLNSYRLEIARYLLKNTSYNITEIALSCGFNHLSYFSEIFKRKSGMTPREYREQK